MTDNVVELPTPNKKTQNDTVELLEDWLEKAKAGEVESVVLIGTINNGIFRIQMSDHDVSDTPALLSGTEVVKKILIDFLFD